MIKPRPRREPIIKPHNTITDVLARRAGQRYRAGMTEPDAQAMIAALTEPDALVVFAAITVATSNACRDAEMGYPTGGGVSWVTPSGLQKRTGLPQDTIERTASRLERVRLLKTQDNDSGRYSSWRVDEVALTTAAAAAEPPHNR
jgi:DNA-binding IclR family transcriptional regulator